MAGAGKMGGALGLLLLALLAAAAGAHAFATPGASGPLTLDSMGAPPSAVWKITASPPVYQVNETIVVSAGDILQIPEGVRVEFVNGTELIVLGGLEVQGTPSQRVEMAVVPDAMSMTVAWGGVRAAAATPFVLSDVVFTDMIDIAFSNASGARLTNVTYQGRLFFDNASDIVATGLLMTITPTDVGRISLWLEHCNDVQVTRADFHGGTGWGGAAVIIENSADVSIGDLTVRDDNANLMGVQVILSTRVIISNFTFTQGPMGGDPNQGLDFRDADATVVDRVVYTHVGQSGLGAIYGVRSNVTISNSSFDPALSQGVWQYPGTLTGLNATNLPVRPEAGATVREVELVRADVRWSAGGPVGVGTAEISNASWNAQGPVVVGFSPWLWALRSVNVSGAVTMTSAYRLNVMCNCSGGTAFFNLIDAWAVTVVAFVDDGAPPVPSAMASPGTTAIPLTLDGTLSFDNAAVVAYLWTALGGTPVGGLPCSQARCTVTVDAPGNITFQLHVTDASGLQSLARVTVFVRDATPPVLGSEVVEVMPGQGEAFTIGVNATDNDPAFLPQVEWYLDGQRVPGDTLTVTLTIDTLGAHAVQVVVRDDGANAANRTFVVIVQDTQAPRIVNWEAPLGLVAPATLRLDGSIASDNVAVTAWRWHIVGPGSEYNLTGAAPNATFPAGGHYNVTLTVEDGQGNSAGRRFEVEVGDAPQPAVSDLPLLLLIGVGAAAAVGAAAFILRAPKKGKGES